MGDNRIAIGKSSEMHRNTSGIHCGIMDTVPYCVKRLDYQVVWPFYVFCQERKDAFAGKMERFHGENGAGGYVRPHGGTTYGGDAVSLGK